MSFAKCRILFQKKLIWSFTREVQASINGPSVTSDFLCGRCSYLSRHDAGASISWKFSGIDLAVETGSACPVSGDRSRRIDRGVGSGGRGVWVSRDVPWEIRRIGERA